ncbi:clp protease family protein [Escherichia coli 2850750]|nr:head maturation protease, ClpP-related [Escherichia coli]EMW05741.1 clp protease family protein [Escherichia coli 2850750]
MNRWYTIKAADVRGAADISIYEEIGGFGVTAKQFAEDLKALGDVSHINLRIHSPGGDVFEGIAIYNLLRNHPADITVYIDGVAASMASGVAMAGDRVVMPENAMMMIHYPSHYLMGTHEEPYSFINLLLIMKKEEVLFALLFYCFSALQLSVYCNVYCRMRFYGGREQVKRQGVKGLTW